MPKPICLAEVLRWNYIFDLPECVDIAVHINYYMKAVETVYPYLEGILPNLFITKQGRKEEIKRLSFTATTD